MCPNNYRPSYSQKEDKRNCLILFFYWPPLTFFTTLEATDINLSLQHKFLPSKKPYEWSSLIDIVASIFFYLHIAEEFSFQSTLPIHVHRCIWNFVFLICLFLNILHLNILHSCSVTLHSSILRLYSTVLSFQSCFI